MSNDLEKKLPGYNPDTVLKPHEEQAVARWQAASGPSKHWDKEPNREDIPRMEGPARVRGLHRMTGKTQTRMQNGKREYLMHRAMSPAEAKTSLGPTHVQHAKKTSWTPVAGAPAGAMYSLVHHFQQEYGGPIASAWIPEDKIHAMLPMWGRTHPNAVEEDQWTRENTSFDGNAKTQGPGYQNTHWEVVVDPHQSQLATPDEQKVAFADDHEQLDTRINQRTGIHGPALGATGRLSVGKPNTPGDLDPEVYYNQNLGKSEVLYKAIADLKPGTHVSSERGVDTFSYDHMLTTEHKAQGYKMIVTQAPEGGRHVLTAQIHQNGANIGGVWGHNDENGLNISTSSMGKGHKEKGLGTAAYQALMAHAYHGLGARSVRGTEHSTGAANTHLKISAMHGMDYQPNVNPGEGVHVPRSKYAGDPFDGRYQPYSYALKNELAKATRPQDLASIGKATTPDGPKAVDHTPHLNSHPPGIDHEVQAYRNHVVNSPQPVKKEKLGEDTSGGITKKVIYKVGDQKYMVKPYHEKIITRVKKWMSHPVQGWAEMANQALYHAGGIGHLHQKVHVTEHDFGNGQKEPALVVHLTPGHTNAASIYDHTERKIGATLGESHGDEAEDQGPHHDTRRIAMMDFLTNNLDRHGGNLLRNDNTRQPLAVDHSRSFQYQTPNDDDVKWAAPTKRPRELHDTFGAYHKDSSVNRLTPFYPQGQDMYGAPYGGYQAKMQAMTAYRPTFDWWGQNSANIRSEMGKQLEQIKDPKIKDHIKTNFDARADWLDEIANIGVENYGDDWHKNQVPIYKPGEKP